MVAKKRKEMQKKSKKAKKSKDFIKEKNILPSKFNKVLGKKYNVELIKKYLYSILITNIIVIIYVISIIYYLNNLKVCSCFNDKNKNNYSNINYLIVIECIILAMQFIVLMSVTYMIYILNKYKNGGNKENKMIMVISILILFLIYGYFVYYVFKLSKNISDECECSKSWLRYLLYIQTFFIILNLVGYGIALFNI